MSSYTTNMDSRVHENILSTIGNTPVVRLNHYSSERVEIFAKLEAFNPLGSVKDRLALGVIEAAERDGSLQAGQTVIEATSGNTGIGLAMVCAQKGYPLVVTMAESFSVERRRLMRFLGARVILTPASDKGTGMLNKAIELADEHGWFLCRQFSNEANANFHSNSTAVEILNDFPNGSLDYFVSGFGTGGTMKGISRKLRECSPETRIIGTEPDNAQVLGSGIKQAFSAEGDPASSHPSFRPHLMQGWSPDFISKLSNDVLSDQLLDQIIPVSGEQSMQLSRELARKEGIFCGISSGATLAAALEVAKVAKNGSKILVMLPDTGERYLSTPLFSDISENMCEEEVQISQTTPGYRFDSPGKTVKDDKEKCDDSLSAEAAEPTAEAAAFLKETTQSAENPVVLFSLEWCEFCWSVRKLFEFLKVPYVPVNLDSVQYQKNDWGGDIRVALNKATGQPTIPQIYVGGIHLGGCTDVFDAYKAGILQKHFDAVDLAWDRNVSVDPYTLLPKWLHPR